MIQELCQDITVTLYEVVSWEWAEVVIRNFLIVQVCCWGCCPLGFIKSFSMGLSTRSICAASEQLLRKIWCYACCTSHNLLCLFLIWLFRNSEINNSLSLIIQLCLLGYQTQLALFLLSYYFFLFAWFYVYMYFPSVVLNMLIL